MLALFTIYATGNHSYRDLANWLNGRADIDRQRRTLKERRRRLRDLYKMGDIERAEYRAKCAEIDEALGSMAPGPTADLDDARAVLEDFGRF